MNGARRLVSALVACLALAGCRTPASAPVRASSSASAQDAFWDSLQALCGSAFRGTLRLAAEGDAWWDVESFVMHVRSCSAEEIRIPLHVDADRSRTWVLRRSPAGLSLSHDHRQRDGSPDSTNTNYGGGTLTEGSRTRQDFPADAYSVGVLPARLTQRWYLEVHPDRTFAYGLRRESTDLEIRLEFDLREPVAPPPAPWGE